ncbi:MAG: sulfate adenylyltransferase subunit CysD, partial [Methylobacteriaceae bacterium]|nr:sulfate adenylyltransferase subunit CysD [Methylobacteriaceae bacterium]
MPERSFAFTEPPEERRTLDRLEAEAIHIIREVAAQCAKPGLLFSGGKDSMVVLHLARKAFAVAGRDVALPMPVVHINTGHNFPEVIAFRDNVVKRFHLQLVEGLVEDSIRRKTVVLRHPLESRNAAQSVTLLETVEKHGFDALLGGARRDEEKARAKERIFSFRDEFGQWEPKNQRPEVWKLYNARVAPGEQVRVFPLS